MGAQQIDLMTRPQEYFRERVVEAMSNQKVEVADEVEFYLVNLLCDYVKPTKVEDTPLAFMLKQALESPPSQRLKLYKQLGDTSLYVAGFFQDFFNRKAFDIGYYINLGASAYDNVSTIMRDLHGDEHFTAVFQDLAAKFTSLVDVVAEVSEGPGSAEKPVDLLAVYDRWTRCNSDRLARVLKKAGIIPLPTASKERQ